MADLEQLRQEAENLRKKIRVSGKVAREGRRELQEAWKFRDAFFVMPGGKSVPVDGITRIKVINDVCHSARTPLVGDRQGFTVSSERGWSVTCLLLLPSVCIFLRFPIRNF